MSMNFTNINLPTAIRDVLQGLLGAGYAAYLVGGAVRDMVIGRKVVDYDITTAAKPEAVIGIASQQG